MKCFIQRLMQMVAERLSDGTGARYFDGRECLYFSKESLALATDNTDHNMILSSGRLDNAVVCF